MGYKLYQTKKEQLTIVNCSLKSIEKSMIRNVDRNQT